MANCVHFVLDDIQSQCYHSQVVDTTRVVSAKEQLPFHLDGKVILMKIGLVEVERTDATSLKFVINDVLVHSSRQWLCLSIQWSSKYGRMFEWYNCTDPEGNQRHCSYTAWPIP